MALKLRLFLFFLLLAAGAGSCKKYPEGPFVSLRSKKDRLSNIWVVEHYLDNGIDRTDLYVAAKGRQIWRFGKDGSFDVYGTEHAQPVSRSGDWEFIDDKKSISMLNQASDSAYYFRVTRLKEKELWLFQLDTLSGLTTEFRFKEKQQ